jgi:DNA-binding IclR family transcriptional regulator
VGVEGRRFGSLVVGIEVLEKLASNPDGGSVTSLAAELGLDKGYLHRLLRVLEDLGYIDQDPYTKIFRSTVKLVSLSTVILQHLDVLVAGPPVMRRLLQATGEAVHLARRIKTGGVYVAQERPSLQVSVETEIGSQPELHCTATGKALIAYLADDELAELVREPLTKHTRRTIPTVADLTRELSSVRSSGFAVDDEELNPGVRCVAAPIFDMTGKTIACLGLSGPTSRVTLERVSELGVSVREAADEITAALGGSRPLEQALVVREAPTTVRRSNSAVRRSTGSSRGTKVASVQ